MRGTDLVVQPHTYGTTPNATMAVIEPQRREARAIGAPNDEDLYQHPRPPVSSIVRSVRWHTTSVLESPRTRIGASAGTPAGFFSSAPAPTSADCLQSRTAISNA